MESGAWANGAKRLDAHLVFTYAGAGAARGTCWTLAMALVASLWRWMMHVYCGGGVGGVGSGQGCRGLEGTLRRGGVSVHGLL